MSDWFTPTHAVIVYQRASKGTEPLKACRERGTKSEINGAGVW